MGEIPSRPSHVFPRPWYAMTTNKARSGPLRGNAGVDAPPRPAVPGREVSDGPGPRTALTAALLGNPTRSYTPAVLTATINDGRLRHVSQDTVRKELKRMVKAGVAKALPGHRYALDGATGRAAALRYLERGRVGRVTPTPPRIAVHRRYQRLRTALTPDRLRYLHDRGFLTPARPGDRGQQRTLVTSNIHAVISRTGTVVLYALTDSWEMDTRAYLGDGIADEARRNEWNQHVAINENDLMRTVIEDANLRVVRDNSTFGADGDIEIHGKEGAARQAMEVFLADRRDALEMQGRLDTALALISQRLDAMEAAQRAGAAQAAGDADRNVAAMTRVAEALERILSLLTPPAPATTAEPPREDDKKGYQ